MLLVHKKWKQGSVADQNIIRFLKSESSILTIQSWSIWANNSVLNSILRGFFLVPFSRFQYILMLVEALGLLNWTICSYTSVIISPLEQERKSHLQLEKNRFFFFWLFYLNVDLKLMKSTILVALEWEPLCLSI